MRWFKHLSAANKDENLSVVLDSIGLEGYGIYWVILETIAEQMQPKNNKTSVRLPVKTWARISGVSPKKFRTLAEFLANRNNFAKKTSLIILRNGDNWLEIDCPNLLKYRDEFSKKQNRKSGVSPE